MTMTLKASAKWLREAASEIARSGHAGWGNACAQAADAIDAHIAVAFTTPSIEAAEAMGAKGGPAVEAERIAFEAWMHGHCWALCATWDGKSYRSDAEQGGDLDPRAIATRRLWAAWRDRAALAAPPIDIAAVRELIAEMRSDMDFADRFLLGRIADKLEAATEGRVDGS